MTRCDNYIPYSRIRRTQIDEAVESDWFALPGQSPSITWMMLLLLQSVLMMELLAQRVCTDCTEIGQRPRADGGCGNAAGTRSVRIVHGRIAQMLCGIDTRWQFRDQFLIEIMIIYGANCGDWTENKLFQNFHHTHYCACCILINWNSSIICDRLTLLVVMTTNRAIDCGTFYPFSLFSLGTKCKSLNKIHLRSRDTRLKR